MSEPASAAVSPFARFITATGPTPPSPDNSGSRKRRAEAEASKNGAGDESGAASGAGSGNGNNGATVESTFNSNAPDTVEKARSLIKHIGKTFVKLRRNGRSQAWAALEEELMLNADLLIAHGMISAKEWIGMAIEIEGFRKSESGTQQLPGDFLAKWLAGGEIGSQTT